ADPKDADELATAWQTLLAASLSTWPSSTPGSPPLSVPALVSFARSMLHALPSSSHDTLPSASNAQALSELLVDTIWALDAQIDDHIADTKASASAAGEGKEDAKEADVVAAQKAKAALEKDKETLAELVKRLSRGGVLDPGMARERLDSALVSSAGLIADKTSFERREIRTRTALFYKQNKYNLLREQSEGFSKLLAEITSSLPPSHPTTTGRPQESKEAMLERVRPVWEHLLSLIGYFDLDPNRALDVILDVFSVHIGGYWSFFLALLSLSPWKGNSKRMSWSSEDAPRPQTKPLRGQYRQKDLDEILRIAEGDAAPTLSTDEASQAKVMAQVLGFKFRHYQAPDVKEVAPPNLSLMAALLIREGFVTLDDLYPHLSPSDEDMGDREHKAYLASIDARIAAAKVNRLAMAGALADSGSSAPAPKPRAPAADTKVPEEKQEKQMPNQKLDLLVALLGVGALRPGLAILTKFPWLKDAHPAVADLLIRVMRHSITPLFDAKCPPRVERSPSWQQPRARYGPAGVQPPPPRKTMLTLCAPTPPGTMSVDFIYFFPDWSERVPLCATLEDLEDVIEPIMAFVGLQVSRDTLFMTKFLRLVRQQILPVRLSIDPETKKIVKVDPEHPVMRFSMRILRLYMLPALPLIRGNAVATVEVWNVMRFFEITLRWRFYGEWKTHAYKTHPELRVRAVQADREAKGILRRLSSNTAETLLGPVAKLAHGNPIIFFTAAVNQIMAYDNLAMVVILSLRYVTTMGFDVLLYVVLEALANAGKPRVKDDGVNISDWLQSLASFTGMLFRRYTADLTPILSYTAHQLFQNAMTETVVLKELVWKMAGIEPLPSLNDLQVQAMAGGPALRTEAIASTIRGAKADPADMVLKGPARLKKALLESGLARPLLIQIAQLRESAAYRAENAHLKSLASLFDGIHGVLMQYLELLVVGGGAEGEFVKGVVPSLGEMGGTYGISAPVCMSILRPTLVGPLKVAAAELQEQERLASERQEKLLKATLAEKRSKDSRVASPAVGAAGDSKMPVDQKQVETPVIKVADGDVEMTNSDTALPLKPPSPWVPELEALFGDVEKIVPKPADRMCSPGFYITFWQLSTYDLSPPTARYDETLTSLRTLLKEEGEKLRVAERSSSRSLRITANGHRQRQTRLNEFIQTLMTEIKEQAASRVFTLKRLAMEHPAWFSPSASSASTLTGVVVEHCILPRALLSPMDADFSAQIIKVIHGLGARHWHTLAIYDRILGDHIRVVAFSCSEYEAKNYGRFLAGILADLYKWFQKEEVFTAENRTKVNGKPVWLRGFQRLYSEKDPVEASSVLAWPQFQMILRKWHRKLSNSLIECIQTGEYMHVYNAIIILKEVLPVFPLAAVHPDQGTYLNNVMETFIAKEDRGDLKILARAYHASLKKREPLWTPVKVGVQKVLHGTTSARQAAPTTPTAARPADDRPKAVPSTPVASAANGEKTARPASAVQTPSAPRAQLATNGDKLAPSSTKNTIERYVYAII
ncbi:transcription factor/nuclear export subunit protein 2-domain-containing protein, partial [Vararia minispora EC-137]